MPVAKGTKLKTGTIHKRDPDLTTRCKAKIGPATRTRTNWQDVDCAKCIVHKRAWTEFLPPASNGARKKRAGKKKSTAKATKH